MIETLILNGVFLCSALATFAIRYPYFKAAKAVETKDNRQDKQEKILLFLVFSGMMFVPIIYLFTPFLNFANYRLPLWVGIAGAVLTSISVYIFYLSHRDLGRNWSPSLEVRSEHKLVSNGIYKSIRHPMYLSIWLMVLSQALLLQNYVAGLSGLATFALMYFLRVPQEEKMMLDTFGNDYSNYMSQSGRILPKIFGAKE